MIAAKKSLLCIALHTLGYSRLALSAPMQAGHSIKEAGDVGLQSSIRYDADMEKAALDHSAAVESNKDQQQETIQKLSMYEGEHHGMGGDEANKSRGVSELESEENLQKFAENPMGSESDKNGGELLQELWRKYPDFDKEPVSEILSEMLSSMTQLLKNVVGSDISSTRHYLRENLAAIQKYRDWVKSEEASVGIMDQDRLKFLSDIDEVATVLITDFKQRLGVNWVHQADKDM
ncbi:hypothetical protein PtA15_10A514 [Puccinia triticina]|uniref:Uncharacterized protein n=1 Tax=Puccinia triticina TaxID=208348 RepID=A0ABY7CUX3_9BASI|nr:uncharacterized protein PtA15_10A514 [Puccinia triticina]WAQ89091.1 hypothetical protein PtA15_10A514 [Puccinia triticina]